MIKQKQKSYSIIIDVLFILLCIIISIIYICNNNYIVAIGWLFLFSALLYSIIDYPNEEIF